MGQTILVVEDEPGMQDILCHLLEGAGYRVLQATNGQAALSILQMVRPDLILSDVMMPNVDGLALCEKVRADEKLSQVPLIFLTVRSERTDVRQGMALGADDYLFKPFEPEELLSAVQARLARATEARAYVEQVSRDLRKRSVRTLSHELRTPLCLVFGYTELLKATGLRMKEEDLTAIINGLYSGARRMRNLVEDFLLYSRVEAGIFAEELSSLARVHTEPDLIVGRTLNELEEVMLARNVTVLRRFHATGAAIAVNETSLVEIVRRLVDNAAKFAKKEGGRVLVRTQVVGQSWGLEVIDEGIGIRPESLPYIFEAFYQADRDKMEQQGAGLGLAIVRGLVEVFDGRIAVESVSGSGSRFAVRLPLFSNGQKGTEPGP